MQALKIAAVAMNGLLGRTEDNLRAIDQWASRAKDSGADLVLFPELVVHGHNDPNTWYAAEAVPGGRSVDHLCLLARTLDLYLSVGLSEKEQDIVYNTQVLVGPKGYIGAQRKFTSPGTRSSTTRAARRCPSSTSASAGWGRLSVMTTPFPRSPGFWP